jgi:hypothetical protein
MDSKVCNKIKYILHAKHKIMHLYITLVTGIQDMVIASDSPSTSRMSVDALQSWNLVLVGRLPATT